MLKKRLWENEKKTEKYEKDFIHNWSNRNIKQLPDL